MIGINFTELAGKWHEFYADDVSVVYSCEHDGAYFFIGREKNRRCAYLQTGKVVLGDNPKKMIEQYKLAIANNVDIFYKDEPEKANEYVAYCLWVYALTQQPHGVKIPCASCLLDIRYNSTKEVDNILREWLAGGPKLV